MILHCTTWAIEMNFCNFGMNHDPGAGLIAQPCYPQSSVLLLCYGYPCLLASRKRIKPFTLSIHPIQIWFDLVMQKVLKQYLDKQYIITVRDYCSHFSFRHMLTGRTLHKVLPFLAKPQNFPFNKTTIKQAWLTSFNCHTCITKTGTWGVNMLNIIYPKKQTEIPQL